VPHRATPRLGESYRKVTVNLPNLGRQSPMPTTAPIVDTMLSTVCGQGGPRVALAGRLYWLAKHEYEISKDRIAAEAAFQK